MALFLHAPERSFLPAALEVMETPPNPLGRLIIGVIGVATLCAIGWAYFGQVDIVAVAPGKFVTPSRTQVVQAFETSTVAAILVKPGDIVSAGAPLIELDKTTAAAELDRARHDRAQARLDIMRLDAFLAGRPTAAFPSVPDTTADEVRRAEEQLRMQVVASNARMAGIEQAIAERTAERESLRQTILKLDAILPLIEKRNEIVSKTAQGGFLPQYQALSSLQSVVEAQGERETSQAKLLSVDAAIKGLRQQMIAAGAEISNMASADLANARQRMVAADEALAKAARRMALLTLRAPIAGQVQQMHVFAVGGVLTPAEQLLSIAPIDTPVEIEADVSNRDVGFVSPGQQVEIKVDAYPFTRFGLLKGTVVSIDRDANPGSASSGMVAQGAERGDAADALGAGEHLRYAVRVALDPGAALKNGDHTVTLQPGMSIKAEILTGKRRIMDFLLAPLLEHLHDSLRER
ncbi:HlyD family secretion protein/hemolysin D [Neorhizobium galegae]|uniref:HlyD family type I secretion periplasmic adaptor subunit n=1 Tax=Neorhizobium galegae TaxID=399 RepID=UPI001AE546CA|nr:HlyD family type I secretion periplasmic adaptor subunit [Neorhizobium galegae]MBP2551462.1 HlyD family secretion protein/hemolysin D [Neorhizobium galegae]